MSKIAIISQPDQGVLIDVGGCGNVQEAVAHLSNTLQVSNQFWKGVSVALNFGTLELTPPQVAQILAIAKGVGAAHSGCSCGCRYRKNHVITSTLASLATPSRSLTW